MPPRTQRERDEDARREKLEHVEQQVDSGSLEIRTMTDEERAKWARSPDAEPPSRPRRGRSARS